MTTAAAPILCPAHIAQLAARVIAELERCRFCCASELDLQDGIAAVLGQECIQCKREPVLSARDRPDFLLAEALVLEVKIKGSFAQLLRQCARYAEHDTVQAILVVGTPYWIPTLPPTVGGKPLYRLRLLGSLL